MNGQTVHVAGTAGGVGTTTVTALLFSSFTSPDGPALLDHTAGDLGARITGGDEVTRIDERLTLHDLGPHAGTRLLDALADPTHFGVVVTATTPAGFQAATSVLVEVRARHGSSGLRRVLVAAVGVFGSHPTAAPIEAIENEFGRRSAAVIPRDSALAAGGRVPLNRISRESRKGQLRLASYLGERLHSFSA